MNFVPIALLCVCFSSRKEERESEPTDSDGMTEIAVVVPDRQGTFAFGDAEAGAWLCLPRAERFPHVAAEPAATATPRFAGTVDEFVAQTVAAHPELAARLELMTRNRVRRCACGKCVAATLATCNGCGAPLAGVPVTHTDNVFTGFVFGVARCAHFALTISARVQTPRVLVFDDPLALSCCHLNAVPTQDYLPDWRFLLRRPAAGLALVRELRAHCDRAVREQFLANREWRAKVLRNDSDENDDDEAVLGCALAGFNLPPSQFQLHLQYILPPLLPQQHHMLRAGHHFTAGRFVPYDYVVAALAAAAADPRILAGVTLDADTPFALLIERLAHAATPVDYAAHHAAFLARADAAQARLANWDPADFGGFVAGTTLHRFAHVAPRAADGTCACTADAGTPADTRAVAAADKKTLQNYGRPYSPDTNSPTGTYYRFPKDPEDLTIW